MFLNRRPPVSRRLHLLERCVTTSTLWQLGSSSLLKAATDFLDAQQRTMVAYILRLRRAPGEGWLEHFRRSRRVARSTLEENSIQRWGQQYWQRFFAWHGRVARFLNWDPSRIALRSLLFRNLSWWRERQVQIRRGRQELRHPFRGFVPVRLEQTLERSCLQIRNAAWAETFWLEHPLF